MTRIALLLMLAAGLGGCAVYPAPYAYDGPGVVVARPHYGGWGHRGWRR